MPTELEKLKDEIKNEFWNELWRNRDRMEKLEGILLTLTDKKKEPVTGEDVEGALREEGIIE